MSLSTIIKKRPPSPAASPGSLAQAWGNARANPRDTQLRCDLFARSRRLADGNGPTPCVGDEDIVLALDTRFDPEPPAHHDQSERDSEREGGEGRHRVGR